MSAHPHPRLTEQEYLAIDRTADDKSEYYGGRMYAMSGGSYNHVRIIGNLTGELYAALKQSPCAVNPSDLRLRVSVGGLYTYPDVTVVCGDPKFADDQKDTLVNPVFLAEVLSPSTERYDRGFKTAQYRTIESLREYALISQDEPRVEVYTRQAAGGWLLSEAVGMDAAYTLESLNCRVALADIYAKVTFGERELPRE